MLHDRPPSLDRSDLAKPGGGSHLPPSSPAPVASCVVSAGRSYRTQCHQPEGVLRSSRSNRVMTKLLVPAGAPSHANGGERLPPVQPTLFSRYSFGKPGPRLVSGLTSENETLGTAIDARRLSPQATPRRFASPIWPAQVSPSTLRFHLSLVPLLAIASTHLRALRLELHNL